MDRTERAQLERLVERFNDAYRLTRPAARVFGLVPGWAVAIGTKEHRNRIAISFRVLAPKKQATSPLNAKAATRFLLDNGWLDDALAYLERTGGVDDDGGDRTDVDGAAAPDEVAAGRHVVGDEPAERAEAVGRAAHEAAPGVPSAR